MEKYRPHFSLGKKLDIKLAARPPLAAETVTKIKACIDELVDIESPYVGFSPTMSGSAFLPLPEQAHADMMLLTDHKLKATASLKALVEWGPDAMPYLLASLDDKRSTKLIIKHAFGSMGGMWFGNELWGNPLNAAESKALAGLDPKEGKDTIKEYTVRVGDICFVALGQIVGRPYAAVRYQPTAITIINSPVEDTDLCRRVRQIWSSDDSRNKLWDSLLTDYATTAAFNGDSLDGWDEGSSLQIDAAMRMLYYFPGEAGQPIADRILKLDLNKDKDIDTYIRRCVANGVRADDFIQAINRSSAPPVVDALTSIFKNTDQSQIILLTMPAAKGDKQLVRARLETVISKLPAEEHPGLGQGCLLLEAAIEEFGPDSEALFKIYLKGAGAQRAFSAACALEKGDPKWSDQMLIAFLDDKRPVPDYYTYTEPDGGGDRRASRVCEMAARSLCALHPDLKFEWFGTAESLDQRITVIKADLTKQVPK